MITPITSKTFEDYLNCETKAYLRWINETGEKNSFGEWTQMQNAVYIRSGIENLCKGIPPDECPKNQTDTESLKKAKWRLTVNFGARSTTLQSSIHALIRISTTKKNQPVELIPIRFILNNQLTKNDKLLLAFDGLVISQLLGRAPSLGKIIHGENYFAQKIKMSPLMHEVLKTLKKITALVSRNSPPELILNRHCVKCEFQTQCRRKAIERDDLSLLSAMSLKERKKLNNKGIFTVTQLSYTFRPRRRARRVSGRPEKYYYSLKALAIREHKIHVVGDERLKIDGMPVYLDVEGVPDRKFYYLIGMRVNTFREPIQHSFWANHFEDEEKIWWDFIEILSGIKNPVLIYYGRFEIDFLKQMADRYGGALPDSAVANAIKSSINLLSYVYARIYFPTYSNGLKDIAKYLGFQWSMENATGIQSILWRREWEHNKDSSLKNRLVTYNAEDCEALNVLTQYLIDLDLGTNKSELPSSRGRAFIKVDSLRRESPFNFKRNQFQLKEMDQINRAAYWDYQREKVFIKSSKRPTKTHHSISNRSRGKLPVNKVILCSRPSRCPHCGHRNLSRHTSHKTTILDIRFGRSSMKRWVTHYFFYRYLCSSCGRTFASLKRNSNGHKYGQNIQALSIYMNIQLRIPQIQVVQFFNQIFGLQLSWTTTHEFKKRAATLYTITYEHLINKILKGEVIHIDETRVNVKGMIGYIWVFTSLEEVVYIYSPTREGDLVQLLLKDFKGVLISDFYSAYDSINCAQQKCLIHLIRDLNDDLFKEPFNREMKELATEFSGLLKSVIETTERFGLKKRFLRKHKYHVDCFFKALSRREYHTETAAKFKKRFEKNRNRLFTFLDYDGVSWNNNNAEHAIKALVKLRRDFGGVTTERGVKDYMVLLSICETCSFKRVSFLEFLLSGERNIDAFIAGGLRQGRNRVSNSSLRLI